MMHMHGHDLVPLTWARAVGTWEFRPGTTAVLAIVAAAYLAATVRLYRRHPSRPWPIGRTISFLAGLAVIVAASMGSPAVYGHGGLFWMHMVAHLMFIMVAPWLLAMGHPITLSLRALRGPARRLVLVGLRSRLVGLLTFPIVPVAGYTFVLIGTHLTGFMDTMMRHDSVMLVEQILYLGSGYLFFNQVLTREPARYQVTYPIRLVLLFISMLGDTLVGVVLLQTKTAPFTTFAAMSPSWGPGPVDDVRNGGALMWIGGDGIMLVMMMVLVMMWLRGGVPEQEGFGRFLENVRSGELSRRTGTSDDREIDPDSDEALEAYNRMLARLHGQKPESASDSHQPR